MAVYKTVTPIENAYAWYLSAFVFILPCLASFISSGAK